MLLSLFTISGRNLVEAWKSRKILKTTLRLNWIYRRFLLWRMKYFAEENSSKASPSFVDLLDVEAKAFESKRKINKVYVPKTSEFHSRFHRRPGLEQDTCDVKSILQSSFGSHSIFRESGNRKYFWWICWKGCQQRYSHVLCQSRQRVWSESSSQTMWKRVKYFASLTVPKFIALSLSCHVSRVTHVSTELNVIKKAFEAGKLFS